VLFALTVVLSLGVALYVAPMLMAAAHRYGILDRGDGRLKVQREPVPYLGGLAVFIALLVALAFTQQFDSRLLALLLGAALVVSVGLVDDLGQLTPKDKFLGQVLAAVVMVKGGISIGLEGVPWYVADLASVLWVVSVTNAFNIIDVSDGLCAGVGTVVALALGLWCLHGGAESEAYLCAALAGGLLGFLRFNWRPARMYLGDTGSMLVGLLLASVVLVADWSPHNEVAPLVAPLAFVVVPLFDLTFVVVVRMWMGQRAWHGSPDHFAVRLRRHGVGPAVVAVGAMVVSGGAAVVGLVAVHLSMVGAAVVGGAGVVACLAAGAWLWRLDPRRAPGPAKEVGS
jgi:UDP-GlcNAc:undecaprenyl-phosphate GlcNAc-1-phosphate transferase